MKKILFSAVCLLCASVITAQQASWNAGGNYAWLYNFGAGTGNAGSVFTGTSVNSVSSPSTQGFFCLSHNRAMQEWQQLLPVRLYLH